MKNIIKRIIADFHTTPMETVSDRHLDLPVDSGKIITLIGPRRSGKSFYFFQLMNQLLAAGARLNQILYLNFEDERLNLDTNHFDLILQAYQELYPEEQLKKCYLFFDEIQNIKNWEKFVRRCYDTVTKNIFLTGSNANLLSTEIATALRGRTITFEILPLSFTEYLAFKKINPCKKTSANQALIDRSFHQYLSEGGYPEITLLPDSLKNKALQEYFDVMTYRDLVERYKFTNLSLIKYFLKRIAASAGSYLSLNKIYNDLRSQGYKLDKNFLYNVNEAAKAVYLSLPVSKFDYSELKRAGSDKKTYFIDNGLLNALTFKFSDDYGKLLENLCYLEFRRRGYQVMYYKGSKECDFILEKNNKLLPVQVCYNLSDPDTKARELTGLIFCCEKLSLKTGVILSLTGLNKETIKGVKVKFVSAVSFFLNESALSD